MAIAISKRRSSSFIFFSPLDNMAFCASVNFLIFFSTAEASAASLLNRYPTAAIDAVSNTHGPAAKAKFKALVDTVAPSVAALYIPVAAAANPCLSALSACKAFATAVAPFTIAIVACSLTIASCKFLPPNPANCKAPCIAPNAPATACTPPSTASSLRVSLAK